MPDPNWHTKVVGYRVYTRNMIDRSIYYDNFHRNAHSFLVLLLEDGGAYKLEYGSNGSKVSVEYMPHGAPNRTTCASSDSPPSTPNRDECRCHSECCQSFDGGCLGALNHWAIIVCGYHNDGNYHASAHNCKHFVWDMVHEYWGDEIGGPRDKIEERIRRNSNGTSGWLSSSSS